uniref:Uncharacterized protein n=2 Tax=Ursus TaxID=9639 RepID=A0A452VCB2_URSMA
MQSFGIGSVPSLFFFFPSTSFPRTPAQSFESDHVIVFAVTSRSPWSFVKKGLVCTSWRCHLRSPHCAGKRCCSLPAHVSMSEAHSHVDHGGPLMDH